MTYFAFIALFLMLAIWPYVKKVPPGSYGLGFGDVVVSLASVTVALGIFIAWLLS